MPQTPSPQNKIRMLMLRQSILEGKRSGTLPEVGVRISIKPDKVRRIRELAKRGHYCAEIARIIGCSEAAIRRYAKDYSISIPKGAPGGPSQSRLAAIEARRKEVVRLLEAGYTQRAIAKQLKVSTYTINNDAQYARARRTT